MKMSQETRLTIPATPADRGSFGAPSAGSVVAPFAAVSAPRLEAPPG